MTHTMYQVIYYDKGSSKRAVLNARTQEDALKVIPKNAEIIAVDTLCDKCGAINKESFVYKSIVSDATLTLCENCNKIRMMFL